MTVAQMAEPRDASRPPYPPSAPEYPGYPPHDAQRSPHSQPPASREEPRSSYPPPPDSSRQGHYPPPPGPGPYPPPGQWAGQPPSAYPPPPHGYYPYPPHRPDLGQPPQPMQPDAYRLPPPYPPHYYPPYPQPQAPAPRQRTAIACKYCRKRKIRCSGYDSSPDGRCQNCVRFNQTCLFHPVSSQAAFVPASAVYGPNAGRAPVAGSGDGNNQNGQQTPMLYGAHGQPLGPAGPQGQPPPQYSYPPPPQGYPPAYSYPPPPGQYPAPAPGSAPHYDSQQQQQQQHAPQHPPPPAVQQQHSAQPPHPESRPAGKRGPPDDDPHNEDSSTSQSPHPNSRPRYGYGNEARAGSGTYEFPNSGQQPTSPATSTMSYTPYGPPHSSGYTNGTQGNKGNNSPPAGLTPQSAQSYHSPRTATADGKTPPPNQPSSAGSSRSGMKVHEMLGNHGNHPAEQRGRNDNDMLNKLDGKK